ncbi:MAG: hypothetical protein IJF39_04285 [Clostridia bacterium]|nr:hypothetical protein [Clostridia bacterium]
MFTLLGVACGDSTSSTQQGSTPTQDSSSVELMDIEGITFTNKEYVYDGTQKELLIEGEMPEGVSVVYENHLATDAGEYLAVAVLSGEGYQTLRMEAKLTIQKADILGVVLEGDSFVYDGEIKNLVIEGELPEGVSISYQNNGKTEAGSYSVSAVLSGKNYNTLTLEAVLRILPNLKGLATAVVNAFGAVPDVWEFLPSTFSPESRLVGQESLDYTNFVDVNSIPLNGMGKQLNLVYGVLNTASQALYYVNQVYAVFNTIERLYEAFLDTNPEDYTVFETEAGAFSIRLVLNEKEYSLYTAIGGVNLSIYANVEEETYGARVQLTKESVLRYEVEGEAMRVAWVLFGVASTEIEFVRNDDVVLGYIYDYVGTDSLNVATCTLMEVGEEYTTFIGTKGDFIPTAVSRNCEVYRNSDGRLVGTEVREEVETTLGMAIFDTLWYPLSYLEGVNTIKKVDEMNVMNPDKIYINGASDTIHTKTIGGFTKKSLSRRFDIEFKTMYFFEYDEAKEKYVSVEKEIPMLFIQEECLEDFEDDFNDKNEEYLTSEASLSVLAKDAAAVEYGYYTLREVYDAIVDIVSKEQIETWCGIIKEE